MKLNANDFQFRVAELKKNSKYYPCVLIRAYDNVFPSEAESKVNVLVLNLLYTSGLIKSNKPPQIKQTVIYASTLVRIKRGSVWYVVHCVESIVLTDTVTERQLLLQLIDKVHGIQYLHNITGQLDDVDPLQMDEKERLIRSTHFK